MKNKVKIIGFITTKDEGVKNPIPVDYLCESEEVPKDLIDELKSVAWSDEKGNIWFPENFYPSPVKGADGDVYLAVGDTTMGTPKGMEVMTDALFLLEGSGA